MTTKKLNSVQGKGEKEKNVVWDKLDSKQHFHVYEFILHLNIQTFFFSKNKLFLFSWIENKEKLPKSLQARSIYDNSVIRIAAPLQALFSLCPPLRNRYEQKALFNVVSSSLCQQSSFQYRVITVSKERCTNTDK